MESVPIELTPREQELVTLYEKAMDAEEYDEAIPCLNELVTIRGGYAITYLYLGDCYRGLVQLDQALENYRKALDLVDNNPSYIFEEGFKEDVSRRIKVAELEKKATLAYQEERYEEAIAYVDEFLQINPHESKAYILRALCDEAQGKHEAAYMDYVTALKYSPPANFHVLMRRIIRFFPRPIMMMDNSKNSKLIVNKLPQRSNPGNEAAKKLYEISKRIFNFIRMFEETILISEDPALETARNEVIERRQLVQKTGRSLDLVGYDENGYFIVNNREMFKRKVNNPNVPYIVIGSVIDDETGEERFYKFHVRKAAPFFTITEKKIRTRISKSEYYYRNQDRLKEKQNEYDKKNRMRKHLRNRIDYLLHKQGISRSYMDASWMKKPTDDSTYHELSSRKRKKRKRQS